MIDEALTTKWSAPCKGVGLLKTAVGNPQVEVGLAQLTARFSSGADPSKRGFEAFAEAGALALKGGRPIARKPSRAPRRGGEQNAPQAPDQAPAEQPLFVVEGSTGVMQVGSQDALACGA